MQSEADKRKHEGEHVIYRAEFPAKNMEDINKVHREKKIVEEKSNLAELGESIKNKFTEGVEVIKELIHEAALKVTGNEEIPEPGFERAKSPKSKAKVIEEKELETVPENFVAF